MLLSKLLSRTTFDSYADFKKNYELRVPARFNFARDVVDAWAEADPLKRALVWLNDRGERREFTFAEISELSKKAANYLSSLGLKKGDRVGYGDTLLRRDTEVAVLAAGTSDGAFTYRDRGLRAFWKQRRKYVLFHGVEAPVIAPPGLTHTMVDVTGLDCHPGDRAVIPHDLVLTSEHVLRRYTEE